MDRVMDKTILAASPPLLWLGDVSTEVHAIPHLLFRAWHGMPQRARSAATSPRERSPGAASSLPAEQKRSVG